MAAADIFKLHSKRIYGPDIIAIVVIVYVPKHTSAISHHRLEMVAVPKEPSANRDNTATTTNGVSESKSSLYFPQFHNTIAVHRFSLLFSGLMQPIISVRADFFLPLILWLQFFFISQCVLRTKKFSHHHNSEPRKKWCQWTQNVCSIHANKKRNERIRRQDGDRVDDAHTPMERDTHRFAI